MEYGKKFSKLRKNQCISLAQAAEGITSKSSLSRWENGTGEMDIDKVLKLLHKIGFNTEEFFAFQYDEIDQKAGEAYQRNDLKSLKHYALLSLRNFHNDPESFINLFDASVTCNGYLDLTNINLFSKHDLSKLVFALSNTHEWSQERIELFGGSILLLPPRRTYAFGNLIINQLEKKRMISDFQFSNTYEMIINAIFALIERKALNLSEKLFNNLNKVPIKEVYMITRTRKEFCHAIISFCKTRREKEITDIFKALTFLNMPLTLSEYQVFFKKVKQLYKIND